MTYKALYRTYRPNSFDEVSGQQHIVKTLQHAVEKNKIAHAYLFCGPRGTGKTSIAKIFAKAINCTSDEGKPCLHCENCQAVKNGTHPDIIEIDAASNNGVEEVRNLIEKVKYAPLKGKYKIYIIDEVHMMSTGAFNALLKTIEEPPEHVIFILATTEPHKVLPTIISRCQRYDFTKVSKKEIEDRIKFILKEEQITCEDEVVRMIAQLADGGMRDALSILDQCIAYAENDIKLHHINEIYGITTISEKLDIFRLIHKNDPVELMNRIDEMIEKGIDIKRLTIDLIEILKETVIYDFTKDANLLHILEVDEVNELKSQTTNKQRFSMIHLLMDAYDKYKSAANAGSYFEVCLLQMLDIFHQREDEKVIDGKPVESNAVKPNINVSRETLSAKREITIAENTYDAVNEEMWEEHGNEEVFENTEIIKEENINKSSMPLKDEFILGLLAGANKPEKAKDINMFIHITDYLSDLPWAKYAALLKNSKIIGSGSNYMIVAVDNQPEANEINDLDSKNEFSEFIEMLLDKNKKVFAITKEHALMIVEQFKKRMAAGTLPQPIRVETAAKETKEEKEKTQEEVILNLFGEENIVITEE